VEFFDQAYQGVPPWDIGRPQPEIVRLEESGEIRGRVLDTGCGTGENALFLQSRGHETWGVDFAPTAIAKAQAKAAERHLPVTFRVASALELGRLNERFDTTIDCGLFHTFLDQHRAEYARSLSAALAPGGRSFILCFSEREPTDWGGPRRVTQDEIRATFRDGWKVRWIREARFATSMEGVSGLAWLAALERGTDRGSRATPRAAPAERRRTTRKTR
jgi:cyclopropane fatty-acyl-phospholipid synthase-like methyltransferase